jgi:protein-tyrosine phosphatase
MAHGILRERIEKGEIEATVDSAGTGDWHIGESPDSRAAAVALDNGIDISDLRARQFREADFSDFDWIIVMDDKNYEDAQHLKPANTETQLVRLTDYHPDPAINRVPDPYLEGGFDSVFEIIRTSIDHWLQKAQ